MRFAVLTALFLAIAPGAVAKFLRPELNTRVMPGSFSVSEDHFPVATFTLVEVPQ